MHASGRPLIFWEQQALEKSKKNNKKFSYKKKEQKFPLRPTGPYVYSEPAMSTAGRNQRTVPNGKVGVGKRVVQKAPATQPSKPKKTVAETGTVTLTQNQLNAILETIGRLTMNNERQPSKTNIAGKERVQSTKSKGSSQGSITQTRDTKSRESKPPDSQKTSENISKLVNGKKDVTTHNSGDLDVDANTDKKKHCAGRRLLDRVKNGSSARNSREMDNKQPRTTDTILPDNNTSSDAKMNSPPTGNTSAANDSSGGVVIDAQGAGDGHVSAEVIDKPASCPMPLTKTELKKLQWQREKAEQAQLNSFNPWGRPGAGAPIKDISGNLLNDFNTRKDQLYQQNSIIVGHTRHTTDMTMKATADISSAKFADVPLQADSAQPPAIRSNFALGVAAPDGDRYTSVKERERKQWLDELDKQRDEERLRKQQEKIRWQESDIQNGFDHTGYHHHHHHHHHTATQPVNQPVNQSVNQPVNQTVNQPIIQVANQPAVPPLNMPLSPRGGVVARNDQLSAPLASTFLHGQNIMIDTETRNELEERRKRQLEHQEFICKQVEEKRLQKEMEKKRKLEEEMDSEKKLQEQRNELHKQFASEQQRLKDKQQAEQKRFVTMTEVMARAREEAERAKHEKHVRKLKDGGHDVSQLCNSFEERPAMTTARSDLTAANDANTKPTKYETEKWSPRGEANEVRNAASQVRLDTDDSVVRREFATQTEREMESSSRESTHIEYQPDVVKVVRVKSPPTSAKHGSVGGGGGRVNSRGSSRGGRGRGAGRGRGEPSKQRTAPMKIADRPRWGAPVPGPVHRPVKQSDRDPTYDKRRKRAASVERQKELQALADLHSPRAAATTTVASRARSRSPPLHATVPSVANEALQRARDEFSQDPYSVYERRRPNRIDSEPSTGRGTKTTAPHDSGPKSHRSQGPSSHRSDPPPNAETPTSPTVPAMRHKPTDGKSHTPADKYVDKQPVSAPLQNGDFVPFIRSMNVLDPARADSPLVVSRENTATEKARQAYIHEHAPATYGNTMANYNDVRVRNWKDPLCNPSMVTDHPTARQDRILAQLSDLRKGLKQKQREVEIGLAACGVAPPPPGGAVNRALLHADE